LLSRLHRDFAAAMGTPELRDRILLPANYTVHLTDPAATAAFLREDLDYKRRLIALAGIE
jgi:hypothetical protein